MLQRLGLGAAASSAASSWSAVGSASHATTPYVRQDAANTFAAKNSNFGDVSHFYQHNLSHRCHGIFGWPCAADPVFALPP